MIYSYVAKTIEDGGWTGASRHDEMLRELVPGIQSVSKLPGLAPGDVVITDNHLSVDVPAGIPTIVCHLGCARTHWERETSWRTPATWAMVERQGQMFNLPNRTFVAPSAWVAMQFRVWYELPANYDPIIIPPWVNSIEPFSQRRGPIVIGDWRDANKGAGHWRAIADKCRGFNFIPLHFRGKTERQAIYDAAGLYLCLSASEGGAYSVADAEQAELPIVTTEVGNYIEFPDCATMNWKLRESAAAVADKVQEKFAAGRVAPSFYCTYTKEVAMARWAFAIDKARAATDPIR